MYRTSAKWTQINLKSRQLHNSLHIQALMCLSQLFHWFVCLWENLFSSLCFSEKTFFLHEKEKCIWFHTQNFFFLFVFKGEYFSSLFSEKLFFNHKNIHIILFLLFSYMLHIIFFSVTDFLRENKTFHTVSHTELSKKNKRKRLSEKKKEKKSFTLVPTQNKRN